MKKKLLLVFATVLLFVCVFAVSINAETVLKPQTTNEYGDLSLFDESITVGRTNTSHGFTPYIDAEGTTYARIVVGDGSTFYTFPTAYALSNSAIYGEGTRSIYHLDLSSLNSAMETATGTNPNWSRNNVYRIELPSNTTYLNGGSNQAFQDYANIIEIRLQPNTTTKDSNKQVLLFWNCKNLEVIHNMDTYVFKNGTLGGAFQNNAKLTNLTIGVSPDVTATQDNFLSGCTGLQTINFKEAFPNLTTVGKNCFYGCTNLTSTSSEENVVAIPNSVKTISQQAFQECKSMKYVSLPATITKIENQAFRNCTALEYVDFNDNQNNVDFNNFGHFMGCTSLKAFVFPTNVQTISNRMLSGCTSLEAVFLPENAVKLGSNGNGQGPFCGNGKMYFVQDAFEVRDENGKFYGDSFVMPQKPSVYFMPSTLTTVIGHVRKEFGGTGGSVSGSIFQNCTSLNDVIVFSENFNYIGSHNLFNGMGTSDSPKTVVFLGDIQGTVTLQNAKYVSLVFASKNDKTPSDLGVVNVLKDAGNTDSYMYFCVEGTKYNYHTSGSEISDATAIATYLSGLEKISEAMHVANPNLTESTKEDCVTNRTETTYCFCGVKIGTKEVENTKLGHEYDLTKGAVKSKVEYTNYLANGTLYTQCARCEECQKSEVNPLIAEFKGFSVNYDGDGITFGYVFDDSAIKEFETVNKTTLEFGFVAGVKAFIGDKNPLDEGVANVVKATVDRSYTAADFVLRGNWDKQVDLDGDEVAETDVKEVEFYMAGYMLVNGNVVYLNANGSSANAGVITFEGCDQPEIVE